MMPKYIVTKSDGTEIPENEPCWVFRARDALMLTALRVYRNEAIMSALPEQFIKDIDEHISKVIIWQDHYGVKLPDLKGESNHETVHERPSLLGYVVPILGTMLAHSRIHRR